MTVKKEVKKIYYIPSMKTFLGHGIKRDPTGIISFGCGAVKVNRADLIAYADVVDNPEVFGRLKEILSKVTLTISHGTYMISEPVTPKEMLQISKVLKKLPPELELFYRLYRPAMGRIRQNYLLGLSSDTLRRIAGKVPKQQK